jgi:hypothetical protein
MEGLIEIGAPLASLTLFWSEQEKLGSVLSSAADWEGLAPEGATTGL